MLKVGGPLVTTKGTVFWDLYKDAFGLILGAGLISCLISCGTDFLPSSFN